VAAKKCGGINMKEFKSESKRLLDIMVNSIYTHKEIFLRELISNSSDAVSKRYYRDGGSREDYRIEIKPDKQARTLTVSDNGIGMTLQELEDYLGTIARSGSLSFKKDGESESDESIIGQFGVGFYSAFMVAKAVKVITKKDDTAYEWYSEGTDGYEIKEVEKEDIGTDIILYLKDDTEADGQPDEKYSNFLNEYEIKRLVKKYSDYIQVPIYMEEEFTPEADDGEEPAEKKPVTLNSMVPLWRKNKNELQESDYSDFFRHQFSEYNQPLTHLHLKAEGSVSYDALLYIPSKRLTGFTQRIIKRDCSCIRAAL
jgi:molecular chaperone HtpG